jgi:hypothetical protein
LQHVVFQAIRQNETVEAEVPIRVEGDIPAEKVGLMTLHQLDTVEIEALPRNLPDELVVSAEKLVELHDKITVADLVVPDGVTILTELDHPIAKRKPQKKPPKVKKLLLKGAMQKLPLNPRVVYSSMKPPDWWAQSLA